MEMANGNVSQAAELDLAHSAVYQCEKYAKPQQSKAGRHVCSGKAVENPPGSGNPNAFFCGGGCSAQKIQKRYIKANSKSISIAKEIFLYM